MFSSNRREKKLTVDRFFWGGGGGVWGRENHGKSKMQSHEVLGCRSRDAPVGRRQK
jgi:hypothetical protein